MAPGPISHGNPETMCQHEFAIVRVDRVTGEVAHVGNLTPAVLLSRMDVSRHEWHDGLPPAVAPVPEAAWKRPAERGTGGSYEALIHDRLWWIWKEGKAWRVCHDNVTHRSGAELAWRFWVEREDLRPRTLLEAKRLAEREAMKMDGGKG
jgi:hypothetical protein